MNNNIEETIVSFEVAKLLKEKGFDCYTRTWHQHGNGISGNVQGKIDRYNSKEDYYTSAPTQQLALNWLRVNFGVEILPMRNMNGNYTAHIYTGHKSINEGKDWEDMTIIIGNTSEEAKEEALLYTLKNLIKTVKEQQKQLITEIMNEDAKDGLYEPQPTWDDVRNKMTPFNNLIVMIENMIKNGLMDQFDIEMRDILSGEINECKKFIEQLKQSKK